MVTRLGEPMALKSTAQASVEDAPVADETTGDEKGETRSEGADS